MLRAGRATVIDIDQVPHRCKSCHFVAIVLVAIRAYSTLATALFDLKTDDTPHLAPDPGRQVHRHQQRERNRGAACTAAATKTANRPPTTPGLKAAHARPTPVGELSHKRATLGSREKQGTRATHDPVVETSACHAFVGLPLVGAGTGHALCLPAPRKRLRCAPELLLGAAAGRTGRDKYQMGPLCVASQPQSHEYGSGRVAAYYGHRHQRHDSHHQRRTRTGD